MWKRTDPHFRESYEHATKERASALHEKTMEGMVRPLAETDISDYDDPKSLRVLDMQSRVAERVQRVAMKAMESDVGGPGSTGGNLSTGGNIVNVHYESSDEDLRKLKEIYSMVKGADGNMVSVAPGVEVNDA